MSEREVDPAGDGPPGGKPAAGRGAEGAPPLFDQIPLSLWIEDFSAVRKLLDELRASGVDDLDRYFDERPAELMRCASLARVVDVNAATAKLFGAESREALRTRLDAVLTEDTLPAFKAALLALASGRREHRVETVNRTLRGEEVWIDLHVSLAPGFEDSWARVLVAAIDRTARVNAERALRASEQRFRTICENAPVMIDSFDEAGRCVLWNRQCETTLGWTQQEVAAAPDPLRLFYPDPSERDRVLEEIRRADGRFREYRVQARDGSVRDQLWADFRLPTGQLISVGHDVTEQRRLEGRVRHSQKLESLGVLAGGIAHDFNNLLVGVLGNADLARRDVGEDSPVRKRLDAIESAAHRARDLAHQMLAYSGRAHLEVKPLELSELVSGMADLLEASIGRRAAIRYSLDGGLPPVQGDLTQLRQVLLNLVLNASDALDGPAGEIRISTGAAEYRAEELAATYLDDGLPAGRYVWLDVSDDGRGIAPEQRARIFDPFVSTKAPGRGLGLAVVLGIVRGHRGAISVESEPGHGASFRVLLPASKGAEVSEPRQRVSEQSWRVSGLALVLDDEPVVREVAAQMLSHLGFEVRIAPDGPAALELFAAEAERFSLVLLDLTMPEMQGDEVLRRLRRIRSDVPVLLSSGYTQQETLGRLSGLKDVHFIQKPYRLAELQACVRQMLGERGTDAATP